MNMTKNDEDEELMSAMGVNAMHLRCIKEDMQIEVSERKKGLSTNWLKNA